MWVRTGTQPFGTLSSYRHGIGRQCRRFSGNSIFKPPVALTSGSEQRLRTLAIETSCDDTSVAVLSISGSPRSPCLRTDVLFHEKVTSRSELYSGIHPLVALHSHQRELGPLVQSAIRCLEPQVDGGRNASRPDFISVTRGPGMRANLSVGLDTAKGLATAWNIPLVGVHHMQAHALTPRLCSTLGSAEHAGRNSHESNASPSDSRRLWTPEGLEPMFPFLTILASGGHTVLIDSRSLTEHTVLAETADIALGDCLDKAARAILPGSRLIVPYGKALEDFAFTSNASYNYDPPTRRQEELERRTTQWGWSLGPPLAESKGRGKTSKRMEYSFAGLLSSVERFMTRRTTEDGTLLNDAREPSEISLQERQDMAREVQRVAFEHLASRIFLYLSSVSMERKAQVSTVVVSGGVASNKFLRHVLRSMLDARGFQHIQLSFPPIPLCTDNALMIAWAGMEMFDDGYESELSIQPIRKWSMDPSSLDGGILGVDGWKRRGTKHEEWKEETAREIVDKVSVSIPE